MKELNNLECREIYGGGPVSIWLGRVCGHLYNFYNAVLKPDPNMGIPFAA
jgi:hypothetical protein